MTANPIGTIYDTDTQVVIVHDGMRGAQGVPGPEGPEGPPGAGIDVIGPWAMGHAYGPGDAVTAQSSGLQGASSLFIQKTTYPYSISMTEPKDDAGRWIEVGLSDTTVNYGGVWTVTQSNHPFTKVGQAAAPTVGGWVRAQADDIDTAGVALVREVIDQNTFILQSTGGIPNIDLDIIEEGVLVPGSIYYVSATQEGRLTVTAPSGVGQVVNPILVADTASSGAVVPWKPFPVPVTTIVRPLAFNKFFYTATGGQTDFTGPDDNGNTLDLANSTADVFQNGLNLEDVVAWTFTDTTVTLVNPATGGDIIEIWGMTQAAPLPVVRTKADSIIFDGVTTVWPLEALAVAMPYSESVNWDIYLDGNPQEPDIDFVIIDNAGDAEINFLTPPPTGTDFWGVVTG